MSAIEICRENGQFWKAAALQGGRLFSDSLIGIYLSFIIVLFMQ
jgi:hypothetical protein